MKFTSRDNSSTNCTVIACISTHKDGFLVLAGNGHVDGDSRTKRQKLQPEAQHWADHCDGEGGKIVVGCGVLVIITCSDIILYRLTTLNKSGEIIAVTQTSLPV